MLRWTFALTCSSGHPDACAERRAERSGLSTGALPPSFRATECRGVSPLPPRGQTCQTLEQAPGRAPGAQCHSEPDRDADKHSLKGHTGRRPAAGRVAGRGRREPVPPLRGPVCPGPAASKRRPEARGGLGGKGVTVGWFQPLPPRQAGNGTSWATAPLGAPRPDLRATVPPGAGSRSTRGPVTEPHPHFRGAQAERGCGTGAGSWIKDLKASKANGFRRRLEGPLGSAGGRAGGRAVAVTRQHGVTGMWVTQDGDPRFHAARSRSARMN